MVKNNFKHFLTITMSLALIVFFYSKKLNAQNAETLFQNYYKWGLNNQYNIFSKANVSPTNNQNISYKIYRNRLFALGFVYNFYQIRNWNFKAELQLQWYGNADGLSISKTETILSFNYEDYSNTEHDKLGYLPLSIEYLFFNTGSFSFTIGGGVGLTYYWHYDIQGSSGLAINDVSVFEAFERTDYPLFYLSNHLQTSVYFKQKRLMLQASLIYKKSYTSFRTGHYEFKNLDVSPDASGTFEQSGDFWGISLSLFLKRK